MAYLHGSGEVETLDGDAQGHGDLLQGRVRRAVLGVLDSADVALRKATLCRQLFLGELCVVACVPDLLTDPLDPFGVAFVLLRGRFQV